MSRPTRLTREFLCASLALTVTAMNDATAKDPAKTAGQGAAQGAAPTRLLPFKTVEKTLPNGLKVMIVPTGFPNLVSLQIPVQTGSRNEIEPGKSGFAHFFEHMMFRGTKNVPPDEYQKIVTRAGARQNAYTTDDFTNYHITFAKEDLAQILQIEADRFQNLWYPEAAFRTEARAVYGEYNKNSANPVQKLFEVQRDHAFTTHTYRHTTMGFLKDIEDMPNQYEYSRTFFDRWYRPEYATVIVAGDVDPAQVMPLVETYFGPWKRGSFKVEIPREPEPKGPVYAHVPWTTPTLPWVTVAFHGPAFSDSGREYAAFSTLLDLEFGETSDLYKRLVTQEQVVDQMFAYLPQSADPGLATIACRVKNPADAVKVRDAILKTFAAVRDRAVDARRLADARSSARYGLLRTLDNTDTIAAVLARYVRHARSLDTIENYYRQIDALTPADLQAAARTYVTDNRAVVTTLSKDPLPEGIEKVPALATFMPPAAQGGADVPLVALASAVPQLNVKFQFLAGSAQDPAGKEGLAVLTASMITEAGSKDLRIDEIQRAFFPLAAGFGASVDRDMTTFTAVVHKDNWETFAAIALPMLLDPGFREEDFARLREAQLNALTTDLRSNNEEELGKERLQQIAFAGTPYGHPDLGTVAGIKAITLDDVKGFARRAYNRGNLVIGVSGDAGDAVVGAIKAAAAQLPAEGLKRDTAAIPAVRPSGLEVEIIRKDTRATAISLGHPIAVTRSHPDFAALSVARSWLGEHRASSSHLYQRIREARGMNYGDYAYIEAFPGGMYSFFPPAGVARRSQLFEIWIRPVVPENAHMALRIALSELTDLVEKGLSKADFEATREYLMKNVYLLTSTQNAALGYALDSRWYNTPEYTAFMRERLAKLTLDDVNQAIRTHLSAKNLQVVMITKDAEGLKQKLVSDAPSAVTYEAPKPELAEEDARIGALKLNIPADKVRIVPVEEIFAR